MASDVEIGNGALQKLGAKRIVTLDDASTNARAVNACFVRIRQAELRKHDWAFAIQRHSIAADSPAPTWGRANSFQLPAGFIRLVPDYPEQNHNSKDWVIEGQKIVTNASAPLEVRCLVDVTDANLMDPLFRDLLSTAIALEICEEITQSNTKKDSLNADYKQIVREAKKASSIEKRPAVAPDPTWITER